MIVHTEAPASSWTGQHIDERLPLEEWVGSTESGEVFRTSLPGGQAAAVLLAIADDAGAEEQLAQWSSTAEWVHPHLLHVFECGRAQVDGCDVLYLVTEFPEESLGQVVPDRALTPDEVLDMLGPILDALECLHRRGLVHGRIEPANVLAVGDRLKLSVDSVQPVGRIRRRNRRLRLYDAPETESGWITPAADVWSLGVMLVEALTRQMPGMPNSAPDPHVPLTVPQPFAEIARRCMRAHPAQRCTIDEIRELLNGPAAVQGANRLTFADTCVGGASDGGGTERTPTPPSEGSPDQPRFHLRVRTMEEDDPPMRFPLPAMVGVALLVLMLIAGMVAYSHKTGSAVPGHDQNAHTATPAEQAIKPLPQPKGPTLKGEVAQRVVPEIPSRISRGIRGKVEARIKVVVDHAGEVMNASIVSAGQSRYFTGQALEAARKWRFRPARIHGQPASSVWDLRFDFRQNGTDVIPTEVTP